MLMRRGGSGGPRAPPYFLEIAVRCGRRFLGTFHTVTQDLVDEFVMETHQPLDALGLVDRLRIIPDEVLEALSAYRDMIVVRDPLIRATGDVSARREHIEPRIGDRQIMPRWMAGLE